MALKGHAPALRGVLQGRASSRSSSAPIARGQAVKTYSEVRVSRDGKWLLCSSVDCGTRLAERYELKGSVTQGEVELFPFAADGRRPVFPHADDRRRSEPHAVIYFGSGWVEEPGPSPHVVWRMTKRARARLRQGQAPSFRRRPGGSFPVRDEMKLDRRGMDRPQMWAVEGVKFPALVVCPRCERIQLATPTVLEVSQRSATIRPQSEPGSRSG